MGRNYSRLCVGRPGGCFRVRRRRVGAPRTSSFGSEATGRSTELLGSKVEMISGGETEEFGSVQDGLEKSSGNKIMVVVDSSLEAKGGLDWALSHTVQTQDTLVLLHVANKQDSNGKINNLRATELLHSLKNTCERKKPGVKVEIEVVEGKEKGPMIVEAAKRKKVSLLVIGQKRKRSIWWGLMAMMWTRRAKRRDVADYCVENAQCMTIAVRRKNNKVGGYLITTKRHKNFWLLA